MLNASARSRSDHPPCRLLLFLRCYLALREISFSKQEVVEHVIRHTDVMRQNYRPKTKLELRAIALAMLFNSWRNEMRIGTLALTLCLGGTLLGCSSKPDIGDIEAPIKAMWQPCELLKVTDLKKTNGVERGGKYELVYSYKLEFLGLLGIVWVNVHDNQMDIAETAHRDG